MAKRKPTKTRKVVKPRKARKIAKAAKAKKTAAAKPGVAARPGKGTAKRIPARPRKSAMRRMGDALRTAPQPKLRVGASAYDRDLDRNAANYQPLTPISFLERAAAVFPDSIAIVHGKARTTYADFYARSRRLASALRKRGIKKNDTVAAMLANSPPMLELHYAVPMAGAVLNALNTRLDAPTLAFMLDHGEAKVLITDREFASTAREVLKHARTKPLVVDYDDPEFPQNGELLGSLEYEDLLKEGDPDFAWTGPSDEWDAISLNYTSGTTGNPKGVVFHHRGAALMGYGNIIAANIGRQPVYLWTLPMFHCNGWCFPWSLSVVAGTHVCLRWVRAKAMYEAISEHGVTHMCGAPIVMSTLLNAAEDEKKPFDHRVEFVTAAAPPPEAVLAAMDSAGFNVTHVYGLTETYGPAVVNEWKQEWDKLDTQRKAARKARQGVRYHALDALTVMDPETMEPVAADGETLGEVMFRGNIVMKGYLKNPKATQESFAGGWFHSGDLGVMHADGYIQLKDRSKDIIISGGENISSIEVEDTLIKHPAVMFAAVVARPDEKWGETPCAFIERKRGHETVTEAELIAYCRDNLAHYKIPRHVVFTELPKTSTGKIQKFKLREMAKSV
jgi:fatty-acyl-CoA synthase